MLENLTLKKAVAFAIQTEELGEKLYTRFAKKFTSEKEVSDIFRQLAKDEIVHRQQFTKLLEVTAESEDDQGSYETGDYLKAMAMSDIFSPKSGPFARVNDVQNGNEALLIAFELEKATLGYYIAMKELLGDNRVLKSIIEVEKSHLVNIMKVLLTDAKFRGLQDQWD